MSKIKNYMDSMIVLEDLIKAAKISADFVGYKSLKKLKIDCEKGDKAAICNLFYLHETMKKLQIDDNIKNWYNIKKEQ